LELGASQVFQASAVIRADRDQMDNLDRRDRKALKGRSVPLGPMEIKDYLGRRELLGIPELQDATDSQVPLSLWAVLYSIVTLLTLVVEICTSNRIAYWL